MAETVAERLTRLETKMCLKFEEMERALVIARENIEADKILARDQLAHRLEGMNEFQKRMDKLEGTFIPREAVNTDMTAIRNLITSEIKVVGVTLETIKKTLSDTISTQEKSFDNKHDSLSKLVYIGLGIVLALQLFAPFVKIFKFTG